MSHEPWTRLRCQPEPPWQRARRGKREVEFEIRAGVAGENTVALSLR